MAQASRFITLALTDEQYERLLVMVEAMAADWSEIDQEIVRQVRYEKEVGG